MEQNDKLMKIRENYLTKKCENLNNQIMILKNQIIENDKMIICLKEIITEGLKNSK